MTQAILAQVAKPLSWSVLGLGLLFGATILLAVAYFLRRNRKM